MKSILLTLLALTSFQSRAFVTVGDTNDGCQFATIQEAIDEGETIIRVAQKPGDSPYEENLILDDVDADISGGYVNCAAAFGGNFLEGVRPSIVAADILQPSVLITGDQQQSTVQLKNMRIRNGLAGVISNNAHVNLTLNYVHVTDNTAGGVIIAHGQNEVAIINNSIISANGDETITSGGYGLGCGGESNVITVSNTYILSNHSVKSGGGLFITGQCQLKAFSSMVGGNTAEEYGGGVYASEGGQVSLHDVTTSDNQAVAGSALYVEDEGTNVLITQSHIKRHGGFYPIAVNNKSIVDIENSMIYENNQPNLNLFRVSNATVNLKYVTITDNDRERVFGSFHGGLIDVKSSIIHAQVGQGVYIGDVQSSFNISCSLVNEDQTFSGGTQLLVDVDPQFIAPEDDDYHLRSTSPAIDFCASAANVNADYPGDIDGQTRGYDQPGVDNGGVYDLGADEYREGAYDLIFADNFEVGN